MPQESVNGSRQLHSTNNSYKKLRSTEVLIHLCKMTWLAVMNYMGQRYTTLRKGLMVWGEHTAVLLR